MEASRWKELKKVGPKDRIFKAVIRSARPSRTTKLKEVKDEETGTTTHEAVGKHAFLDGRNGSATRTPAFMVRRDQRKHNKAARRSRKLNRG